MQTRVSLLATRSTCARSLRMVSPAKMMSVPPSLERNVAFSVSRRRSFSAFWTVSKSLSVESGFSRKSMAPNFVARTAISMCACPDIITTGVCTAAARISSRSCSPSLPGIMTSEKMRSKGSVLASSKARCALSQTVASCPARRKARASDARVFASSSTISRLALTFISASLLRMRVLSVRERQLDAESCALAVATRDHNAAAVITHHGLHDRQTKPCTVLLSGVVGSE